MQDQNIIFKRSPCYFMIHVILYRYIIYFFWTVVAVCGDIATEDGLSSRWDKCGYDDDVDDDGDGDGGDGLEYLSTPQSGIRPSVCLSFRLAVCVS